MKTIHKFELFPNVDMRVNIMMPARAEVIHVHEQNGSICAWAMVDPDETTLALKTFHFIQTGDPIPDILAEYGRYHGTCHLIEEDINIVVHVFELT